MPRPSSSFCAFGLALLRTDPEIAVRAQPLSGNVRFHHCRGWPLSACVAESPLPTEARVLLQVRRGDTSGLHTIFLTGMASRGSLNSSWILPSFFHQAFAPSMSRSLSRSRASCSQHQQAAFQCPARRQTRCRNLWKIAIRKRVPLLPCRRARLNLSSRYSRSFCRTAALPDSSGKTRCRCDSQQRRPSGLAGHRPWYA